MASETKFRLALSLLLLALGLLVAKNAFGQESCMGTFPLPKPVGSKISPVTIDVTPKVVATNPYKQTVFHVLIRILEHPDNTEYGYSATCGSELQSSIKTIDKITYDFSEKLTVVSSCVFQVCVARRGLKYPLCVKQEVIVPN